MQPLRQDIHSLQPQVFHYSLDWRFLLPMAEPGDICLLAEERPQFDQALERVGIRDSQKCSLSELKAGSKTDFHSWVMPFGLPRSWAGAKLEDQVGFYASLRRWIAPGDFLLAGFNNAWTLRANPQTDHYSCRPGHMASQLEQAGFQSIKIFGAMPNLNIPEYIFDLDPGTIHFALRNRFRRKPGILRALRLLAGTAGWRRVSDFLPCYFVLATA